MEAAAGLMSSKLRRRGARAVRAPLPCSQAADVASNERRRPIGMERERSLSLDPEEAAASGVAALRCWRRNVETVREAEWSGRTKRMMISLRKPRTQIEQSEKPSEMIAMASPLPIVIRYATCSTVCGMSSKAVVKKVSASSRDEGNPSYFVSRHGISLSTSRLVSASTSMQA